MNPNHALAMQHDTGRIWYYIGDTFVHRILNSKEYSIVDLPDANIEDNRNGDVGEKLMHERIDSAIWEYCFVISHEMEE